MLGSETFRASRRLEWYWADVVACRSLKYGKRTNDVPEENVGDHQI